MYKFTSALEATLSDRGAGIGTREELFAILARIGARLDPRTSTVIARVALDRNGMAFHKIPVKCRFLVRGSHL